MRPYGPALPNELNWCASVLQINGLSKRGHLLLSKDRLDFGAAALSFNSKQTVLLSNDSPVPVQYTVEERDLGQGAPFCVTPSRYGTGPVPPLNAGYSNHQYSKTEGPVTPCHATLVEHCYTLSCSECSQTGSSCNLLPQSSSLCALMDIPGPCCRTRRPFLYTIKGPRYLHTT